MLKRCILSGIAVLILMCGCSDRSGQAEGHAKKRKVIRVCHSHQADFASEIHFSAWLFKHLVEDQSDTLEVRIYAANALGQERELYEGMQLGGGATCVISGTAILNNFNPKLGVLDLPFLWTDYAHVHRALDGAVGQKLAQELAPMGFKVLAWMDSWGYRNVVSARKPLQKPEDLRGLKIRTIESPVYIQAVNAMGASATPMAFGEVYPSLQTGVLDGFEHNASVVKASRFYEVAKYIGLTRHLFGPLVFVYSQADWEKLTEQEQKIVQEAALLARDIQRAMAPIREQEAMDFLAEKGMTINPIDTALFRQKAIEVQQRFAKEKDALDLLEQIHKAAQTEN